MFHVLRKIRKSLIDSGSTQRYILYAIGEIALVVIGILIALQINNWNESIKDKEQERKLLTELMVSLESNCKTMNADIKKRGNWNMSSDIIISTLQDNGKYSDTLNIHFHNTRIPGTNLALSLAGYEGLKNTGFNIISSDVLRNSIIDLFEVTHKTCMEEMEYFESFQPARQIYLDQLFSYDDSKFDPAAPFSVPIIPHDFNDLIGNLNFLSMVKSVKIQRNIIGTQVVRNLKESQRVLQLIREELEL